MGRAPCCDKANVKKGPWSPEEDAKLKAYIENYGTGGNWIALPQKIGLKRCGKSCRLRWLNYLRPNIKHGGFSEEEDNIICSLYISIGSRWSIIAAQLAGRTDNDIKNYWNTKLKKKLLGRRKQQSNTNRILDPNDQAMEMQGPEDNNQFISQGLNSSALERLQLHMQLQSLQINPLISFYNNPALWPKNKVHPLQLQEKMIQTTHKIGSHLLMPNLQPANDQQNYPKISNDLDNSLDGISPSGGSAPFGGGSETMAKTDHHHHHHHGILSQPIHNNAAVDQPVSNFQQAELDEFLNNQMAHDQFNCFKEMNGAKDSLIWWWSSDFDAKSASNSNSWDSTTSVLQSNGMFQDYELGYNM